MSGELGEQAPTAGRYAIDVRYKKQDRLWRATSEQTDCLDGLCHPSLAILKLEATIVLQAAYAGKQTDITEHTLLNADA